MEFWFINIVPICLNYSALSKNLLPSFNFCAIHPVVMQHTNIDIYSTISKKMVTASQADIINKYKEY